MALEERYDDFGIFREMARADGWVMVQRPRCPPFAMTVKRWNEMDREPAPSVDTTEADDD